jgi:hypothetical protein
MAAGQLGSSTRALRSPQSDRKKPAGSHNTITHKKNRYIFRSKEKIKLKRWPVRNLFVPFRPVLPFLVKLILANEFCFDKFVFTVPIPKQPFFVKLLFCFQSSSSTSVFNFSILASKFRPKCYLSSVGSKFILICRTLRK